MAFEKHEKNRIIYFTSRLFDGFSVPHLFAAKRGGVSSTEFSSLNISSSRKDKNGNTDTTENIRENLRRGLSLLGADEKNAYAMRQVHSARVRDARISCSDSFETGEELPDCDGLVAERGSFSALCVKTADCVPILLFDTKYGTACALHAGWRGTVGNICGNAVQKIKDIHPDARIIAAIGPCIGACCYEVNDTVYLAALEKCRELGTDEKKLDACFAERYIANGENKYKVSLSSLNRLFLESSGVDPRDIDEAGLCTCCHHDDEGGLFFSHRASKGFSGTQMSVIFAK